MKGCHRSFMEQNWLGHGGCYSYLNFKFSYLNLKWFVQLLVTLISDDLFNNIFHHLWFIVLSYGVYINSLLNFSKLNDFFLQHGFFSTFYHPIFFSPSIFKPELFVEPLEMSICLVSRFWTHHPHPFGSWIWSKKVVK